MKVHAAMAEWLVKQDVRTMFGLMGDANLFLVDSFVNLHGGTFVPAAHEAGAVLMANGYASISGRVGVATVTHGPALTNTVTALVESARARTPLVLIAGDTADEEHVQSINQREIVAPTGAKFVQVRSPRTVVDDLARAFRLAKAHRLPVVLNVPADFQWEETEPGQCPSAAVATAAPTASADDLDRAVGVIASARRPVILAGRGAISPGSRASLLALSARLGAPLATTLKAKDLFRGEPFDLGISGTLSTEETTSVILESDAVLAFGAGLNAFTTSNGAFLDGKSLVHCDTDPLVLNAHALRSAPLFGDAQTTGEAIVAMLDEAEIPATDFARTRVRGVAGGDAGDEADRADPGQDVGMQRALAHLDRVLPQDRILLTDVGLFTLTAWQEMHVQDPRDWFTTANFGSIGLGMANAIGAAHADRDRPVVLVAGDGGFMMGGLTEFNTAVRSGCDLIVVVLNDQSYGAEYIQFKGRDMDPGLSLFNWPSFASIAESLGGRGVSVRTVGDLDQVVPAIEGRDRPLLIEVHLDPALATSGH